jgi:hypothetical protein
MGKQSSNAGEIGGIPVRHILPLALTGLCFALGAGCSSKSSEQRNQSASDSSRNRTETPKQASEQMSGEAKSVQPQVQAEIGRQEAQKRAELLSEAQSALEETRAAIAALDKGDKQAALAALARAKGKLDVVIARDPKLALAPVDVNTTILDLYATVDAVKGAVKRAKDDLADNRIQQARELLAGLASEARIDVVELPLATYPAALQAVVPLIDAGKNDEAKAALYTALNTLVIETIVIPLPKVRAQAMLKEADQLASTPNRTQEQNDRLNTLLDAARGQIQLAEALGYGSKDEFKPLYSQLDEIRSKTQGGKSGRGFFDRINQSLKSLKFHA